MQTVWPNGCSSNYWQWRDLARQYSEMWSEKDFQSGSTTLSISGQTQQISISSIVNAPFEVRIHTLLGACPVPEVAAESGPFIPSAPDGCSWRDFLKVHIQGTGKGLQVAEDNAGLEHVQDQSGKLTYCIGPIGPTFTAMLTRRQADVYCAGRVLRQLAPTCKHAFCLAFTGLCSQPFTHRPSGQA